MLHQVMTHWVVNLVVFHHQLQDVDQLAAGVAVLGSEIEIRKYF